MQNLSQIKVTNFSFLVENYQHHIDNYQILVIEISEWRQDGELKERKEEVAKRTSSSSTTLIRA